MLSVIYNKDNDNARGVNMKHKKGKLISLILSATVVLSSVCAFNFSALADDASKTMTHHQLPKALQTLQQKVVQWIVVQQNVAQRILVLQHLQQNLPQLKNLYLWVN